ncbi:hypothetical protein ACOBV8_16835 [Pseudoalteromonas espejiana]
MKQNIIYNGAYRQLGIDQQQLVHEGMRDSFTLSPQSVFWG